MALPAGSSLPHRHCNGRQGPGCGAVAGGLDQAAGLPAETGGPAAEGSAVNVALPAGTTDASWLRAFHAIVPPLLQAFRPKVLVSQHGADTHRLDPLAHLQVSIDAQRAAHAALHALAHNLAVRALAAHRRRRIRQPIRSGRPGDHWPPATRSSPSTG